MTSPDCPLDARTWSLDFMASPWRKYLIPILEWVLHKYHFAWLDDWMMGPQFEKTTPWNFNMDTKNDGLETIPPSPFIGGPSSDLHNYVYIYTVYMCSVSPFDSVSMLQKLGWTNQPSTFNNGINAIWIDEWVSPSTLTFYCRFRWAPPKLNLVAFGLV